jgi:hypothetical protein
VVLLKPRGRLRRLPAGFDQPIDVFAKSGVGQHFVDLVTRCRLQDDPGVIRDLPQFGIKLPPNFVGSVVPRPSQIQSEFRQRIESVDSSGLVNIGRRHCRVCWLMSDAGYHTKKQAPPPGCRMRPAMTEAIAHWCRVW